MSLPHFLLKSQAEFAKLSLHEKNRYLQEVADRFMAARGEPSYPLPKAALSRLRRFYSRRSFADLKIDQFEDDDLAERLRSLSDAIKANDIKAFVRAELPMQQKPTVRVPPDDDAQLSFFVPNIFDAPLKDDVNLMDVAPFALSKNKRHDSIRYELKDAIVIVEGGAETGMATAFDYDIFLNMVSYLAEEVRKRRFEERAGKSVDLPPRRYRPSASDILRFCRRTQGGKQHEQLEQSLDRLQATRIKIINHSGGKRRETESFPLIGRYRVVSWTNKNRIELVEVEIPDWVYEGIVTPDKNPSILTLHPDYFLIAQPLARFMYRLARKAAGRTQARYGLQEVHMRSGSPMAQKHFNAAVRRIVEASQVHPLPEYDFAMSEGKGGPVLEMVRRGTT